MKTVSRLFICFMVLGCMACGKKGPPVPPRVVVPQSVKDLHGEVIQDQVRLSWTIPQGEKQFRLFKAIEPLTAEPCPDCPIRFTETFDIDIVDSKIVHLQENKVIYWDSCESGNRYAYKIIVISEDGVESRDSNVVIIGETD